MRVDCTPWVDMYHVFSIKTFCRISHRPFLQFAVCFANLQSSHSLKHTKVVTEPDFGLEGVFCFKRILLQCLRKGKRTGVVLGFSWQSEEAHEAWFCNGPFPQSPAISLRVSKSMALKFFTCFGGFFRACWGHFEPSREGKGFPCCQLRVFFSGGNLVVR